VQLALEMLKAILEPKLLALATERFGKISHSFSYPRILSFFFEEQLILLLFFPQRLGL